MSATPRPSRAPTSPHSPSSASPTTRESSTNTTTSTSRTPPKPVHAGFHPTSATSTEFGLIPKCSLYNPPHGGHARTTDQPPPRRAAPPRASLLRPRLTLDRRRRVRQ